MQQIVCGYKTKLYTKNEHIVFHTATEKYSKIYEYFHEIYTCDRKRKIHE